MIATYRVEVYSPDTSVDTVYRLTIRIEGAEARTENQRLTTTEEMQGYGMQLSHLAEYWSRTEGRGRISDIVMRGMIASP